MRAKVLSALAAGTCMLMSAIQSSADDASQRSLAAAFIHEAIERCGYEASSTGASFLNSRSKVPPGADLQSRFVEQLWRRTWACDPELIGRSCMAARWSLCDRVFDTATSVDGRPSKWWTCFAKRRFMDKSLTGPGEI